MSKIMPNDNFSMDISAYKTLKTQGLFLFIPQDKKIDELPNELLVTFGEPLHVVDFNLTPQRRLALENPLDIYTSITQKGYHLQMPPKEIEKYSDITAPPENLDNIF